MLITTVSVIVAIFMLIQVLQILGYVKINRRHVMYYLSTAGTALHLYWLYLILTGV